ncbi:terpene synthase [Fischerella thermalis CCMEE 5268]|uniref:Terpene synthase n=1 Tax=Fischerella thermalis CCMEE 5268 TaxID=2019662 RepID=A0A2N6KG78_9CYAN|nr:terpene synthase [Fischerella thermalis]PLZ98232.1 terpene synthase [Fischerella thermalis CCMEE 5268]
MNEFTLPELYCPFPYQINKYADVLEKHALEWVLKYNLLIDESYYQYFCKSKIFLLIAGSYPYCDLEELKVANDWLTWMIFLDDYYDTSDFKNKPELIKKLHNRFFEILSGAEITNQDTPYSHALNNLRHRTLKIGNPRWFHFFVCALSEFLDGCVQEAHNRANGILPDVETYIILRRLTGGMGPLFELIEFCNHLEIPYLLRENIILKKLKMMSNNIICWCNDIYSIPKELRIGDPHNLVLLLKNHKKISLKHAITQVSEMHDQEVQRMIELESTLPCLGQELDAELAKYISGIHAWIASHFHWYSHSGRYEVTEKLALEEDLKLVNA